MNRRGLSELIMLWESFCAIGKITALLLSNLSYDRIALKGTWVAFQIDNLGMRDP